MTSPTSSFSSGTPSQRDESFMKGVFGGAIPDSLVFPYPEPSRGAAEDVLAFCDQLRKFAAKDVDSAAFDEREGIGPEILRGLAEIGAFGLAIPKHYGGVGFGMVQYCRAIQEIAGIDPSLALTVSAHQSLGLTALLSFGTEELLQRELPRFASGAAFAAFAFAEVGAGSDAASIQTRADRDGDDYVVHGEKTWVTNGGFADAFVVFARTSPAEDGAKPKLTAFFVPRGEGVTNGPNEAKIGVRGASTTRVTFDRVRVPAAHVLGDVGRGFKVAMEVLTQARIALAASSLGIAKRLLKAAVERAEQRKTFGRPIAEFGLVKDKIATMTADIFALESTTYMTAGLVDVGRTDYALESAVCKVLGSETCLRVADESLQIAGAMGCLRAAPYERLLRDARVNLVFEGTNEILRCFIALSGMQGPGRELEEVAKAMREPIKGFGLLGDLALKKARSALSLERRDRLTRAHPLLSREAVLFEEYVALLGKSVDKVLRRHGKNIAEMQYTQKRVADIAIDLWALVSCLARTTRAIERRGEEGSRREIDLTSVFATAAKRRLEENVAAFDENDDELRKAVAQKTSADGGYPLDVV